MPNHTEVRWFSRGKVLKRRFELRKGILQVLESKGKDTTELWEQKFLRELAFTRDITSHLDALNLQLQGWGRVTTDMLQGELLELKLCLWKN